jgi:nicotinamide mononucleotide transporter
VTFREGALEFLNVLALGTGVAYVVLAAQRKRICWVAGGVSSICAAVLFSTNRLPMQAALQVFYVGMAFYGWWSWTRGSQGGELTVGTWPFAWHLAAAVVLVAVSLLSARWLAQTNVAAWPLLDSLTTSFSLLATWLAARARIENWLYWIVINPVVAYLSYEQDSWGMTVLSILLTAMAGVGFIAWLRRYRAQMVTA